MKYKETEFYQIPKSLMSATEYTSSVTGMKVKLTSNSKNVYVLIKERCRYFTSQQLSYFDSVEQIADATGLSRNTVGKIINDFEVHGVIEIERKQWQGFINKLVFRKVNDLDLTTNKQQVKAPLETALEEPLDTPLDMPLEAPESASKPRSNVTNISAKVASKTPTKELVTESVTELSWDRAGHDKRRAELETKEREKVISIVPCEITTPKATAYREPTPNRATLTDEQREAIRKHRAEIAARDAKEQQAEQLISQRRNQI